MVWVFHFVVELGFGPGQSKIANWASPIQPNFNFFPGLPVARYPNVLRAFSDRAKSPESNRAGIIRPKPDILFG